MPPQSPAALLSLLPNSPYSARRSRGGVWKLVLATDRVMKTPVQLYHLDEDLGETTNLANLHPDRVKSMQATFEKLIRNGRTTPGVAQKNDIKVVRYPKTAAIAKAKKK